MRSINKFSYNSREQSDCLWKFSFQSLFFSVWFTWFKSSHHLPLILWSNDKFIGFLFLCSISFSCCSSRWTWFFSNCLPLRSSWKSKRSYKENQFVLATDCSHFLKLFSQCILLSYSLKVFSQGILQVRIKSRVLYRIDRKIPRTFTFIHSYSLLRIIRHFFLTKYFSFHFYQKSDFMCPHFLSQTSLVILLIYFFSSHLFSTSSQLNCYCTCICYLPLRLRRLLLLYFLLILGRPCESWGESNSKLFSFRKISPHSYSLLLPLPVEEPKKHKQQECTKEEAKKLQTGNKNWWHPWFWCLVLFLFLSNFLFLFFRHRIEEKVSRDAVFNPCVWHF